MTDAVLGIRVHSEGVDKETISLEKLVEAGRRAEHVAFRLAKADAQTTRLALQKARAHEAEAKAAIAALRASGSYTREQLSAARAAQLTATAELRAAQAADRHASVKVTVAGAAVREAAALNKSTAAANDNARAMSRSGAALRAANQNFRAGGVSVGNLAAQFQDVAVSASMGQNALQVALAQGTQISAALGPMGAAGAVKALGAAFASVISPLALGVIGVTALVAAGLQMVDWAGVAQAALNGLAAAIEPIAPYATAAAAALALLYAPSVVTGIVSVISLLTRMAAAALAAAVSLALANPAIAIVAGVAAAVAAMNIFREELAQAFGFDLVKVVKDWGNYLIDVVATAFNTAIGYVEAGTNKIIGIMNRLPGVDVGSVDLSGFKLETGGDHIGALTSAISSGASAAAAKLRDVAAGLVGISSETDKAAKKAAESYASITRDAEQFIAKQQLERDSYLMTAEAAAAMRYEQEMLNQAANDNITLTAAQRENIHGLASAMAAAEAATAAYKSAVDFAKDTSRGFLSDLRAGLKDGESGWASFAGAAQKALERIEDKLFDLATNQIVDNLFAGLATAGGAAGGGGAFSGLLAGIFGGARASGGPVSSGRAYLVGERGPELFVPNANGAIVPNGGGSGNVNITLVNKGTPQDVKSQRTTPGGRPGRDITLELDDMNAKNIRRAGSASNMAVQGLGGRSPIRER